MNSEYRVLREIVQAGVGSYANNRVGDGRSVSVSLTSSNIMGPLAADQVRSAVYGDSLRRLLQYCGYKVTGEFYIDRTEKYQEDTSAASLMSLRTGSRRTLHSYNQSYVDGYQVYVDSDGSDDEACSDSFTQDYVDKWAREVPDNANFFATRNAHNAYREHLETLYALNVQVDIWACASEFTEQSVIDEVLEDVLGSGVEEIAQYALAAQRCAVESGESNFFLVDIIYHRQRHTRCDLAIDVVRHGDEDYAKMLQTAVAAICESPDERDERDGETPDRRDVAATETDYKTDSETGYTYVTVQGVCFYDGSVDSGGVILPADFLDAVGAYTARFMYLRHHVNETKVFNIAEILSENPLYYVQHACEHINLLNRVVSEHCKHKVNLEHLDESALVDEHEVNLLRLLERLPEIVKDAAQAREPHRIADWVLKLSVGFYNFWNHCPIMAAEIPDTIRHARYWLVEAVHIGLAIGLDICGLKGIEEVTTPDHYTKRPKPVPAHEWKPAKFDTTTRTLNVQTGLRNSMHMQKGQFFLSDNK